MHGFNQIWVFNRSYCVTVVGVFVRFRAPLQPECCSPCRGRFHLHDFLDVGKISTMLVGMVG
jgi:hypothetical protein